MFKKFTYLCAIGTILLACENKVNDVENLNPDNAKAGEEIVLSVGCSQQNNAASRKLGCDFTHEGVSSYFEKTDSLEVYAVDSEGKNVGEPEIFKLDETTFVKASNTATFKGKKPAGGAGMYRIYAGPRELPDTQKYFQQAGRTKNAMRYESEILSSLTGTIELAPMWSVLVCNPGVSIAYGETEKGETYRSTISITMVDFVLKQTIYNPEDTTQVIETNTISYGNNIVMSMTDAQTLALTTNLPVVVKPAKFYKIQIVSMTMQEATTIGGEISILKDDVWVKYPTKLSRQYGNGTGTSKWIIKTELSKGEAREMAMPTINYYLEVDYEHPITN